MSQANRFKKLRKIYKEFNKEARKYLEHVACKPGCADCCIDVGNIDTTTLEAMAILKHLKTLKPSKRQLLYANIKKNTREKPRFKRMKCPFLDSRNFCSIYKVRPFSCRRLFSVRTCGESGPAIPRGLWELGEETLGRIYRLDHFGITGHVSYVINLLNDGRFKELYVSGKLEPEIIKDTIQKYDMIINRAAVQKFNVLKLMPGSPDKA